MLLDLLEEPEGGLLYYLADDPAEVPCVCFLRAYLSFIASVPVFMQNLCYTNCISAYFMASVIGSMHYLKDDPAEEQWRGVDLPATQQSLLTVSNKTVVALFTPMPGPGKPTPRNPAVG